MNKNQSNYSFQPTCFSSGSWVAGASPGSSGCKMGPTLKRTPFYNRATHTHSHTHLDKDNLDTPIHLSYTSLEHGRKPEYPEKTHTDMGRTCQLHRQWSQLGVIFFSQQNYNEMTSFKDLYLHTVEKWRKVMPR